MRRPRDERGGLLVDEGAARGSSVSVAAGEAEKDALDIAIDHGDTLAEGDAGDGGAGVLADARKGTEFDGGVGERASALLDDELRRLVEHSGAAVVAEAGPGGEHLFFGGERKGDDGGKPAQKVVVVLDDGGDAGLLQHDFGDPGFEGSVTPRQGSSRAWVRYQLMRRRRKAGGSSSVSAGGVWRVGRVGELEP